MLTKLINMVKRTIPKCDISLKPKTSKKQGFGYFQLTERTYSEGTICEFLHSLEKDSNKKDPNYLTHPFGTVRKIERRTGLHHATIKKAIERLKASNQVIEIMGMNNARLFCLNGSPNSEYIKKQILIKGQFAGFHKLNSKTALGESEDFRIIKRPSYEKRILKKVRKQPLFEDGTVFNKQIKKRETIHLKNSKIYKK